MEILDSSNQVLSHYSAVTLHSGSDFLLKSAFISGFSASLHLALLLGLLVLWVWRRLSSTHSDDDPKSSSNPRNRTHRITVLCCLGVSMFSLAMCLSSYFVWFRNGWSAEELVSLLNLAVKTIAWGAISIYLHARFSGPFLWKFPLLLRIWMGFYLCISCYTLALDIVVHEKHYSPKVWSFVSDIIDVVIGLFICYVGFFLGKFDGGYGDSLLEQPLLNGIDTQKPKGSETATPYSKAGIFSVISFSWMSPLIALGNKKTLDLEDVPQLDERDSLVWGFSNFKTRLRSGGCVGSGVTALRLAKSLVLFSWKEIMWANFSALIYTLASYVGPYMIDPLVQYLTGRRSFKNEGYVLVSIFITAKIFECLSQRQWYFRLQQVEIRTRAALVGLIYEKGLTLSCHSRQAHTSGEMINFMSVDAERVGSFSWFMHDPWLVFLQVGLALAILYKNLGLAVIAAFVATVVVMLGNVPLGKLEEKFQEKMMKSKDERMKATSEILKNMRILKLQAWEMKFLAKIQEIRASEGGWLKKYVYTRAITTFLFWVSPTFVSAITFGTCLVMGIPLESGKILSSLATFKILQEPIYSLPDTISLMVQTKVSLDRITSFLRLEDLLNDVIERIPRGSSNASVEITEGNFSWDFSSPSPTLKDINLKVLHGMKVAICGTVGSGKSSLLSCIVGEMPKKSGTIRVCGSKAFVAQSPWIQSGKIEENILFGKEMNRDWYESILDACSLRKDLEVLPFGDQTVIGERGINLSGGQKQRIQIARALYEDADIYLFDDPFSAVDAHTGSHLFKECLLRILGSKTVIYVTHQVEFLPAADLILVMKDGRITQAGKYDEILQAGTDFMELVRAHKTALTEIDSVQKAVQSEKSNGGIENGVSEKENGDFQEQSSSVKDGAQKQLVQEEEREKGSVGFQVYWKYLTTAYRGALIPLILVSLVLFQLLQIGSSYWMAWATPASAEVEPKVATTTLIYVYVLFALVSSLFIFARSMFVATAGYKTAMVLFDKMHHCIFRAPMSFFDSTPSGRILNRASTDQSTVDMTIQYRFSAVANSGVQLLGIIAVMSQVSWQVFIIFIPVTAICVWYQRYYISTARELSRLVGACKAPVIQHFAETMSGLTTIRSFDQEPRFRETNTKLSDGYSRPQFHVSGAMEWLTFRLNMLSSMMFSFALIFLLAIPNGIIDPAIAGLAVTYGLTLNTLQVWVIWSMCDIENRIISVERILQYSSIPSEPPLTVGENRPGTSWPYHGEIDIQNLQVRYAPHMPLVLRGITCTFSGGLKTGIVGRTGGGKSTLIQTLFRIVDPTAGRIVIDGINICSIGVHDLRSRLSIIPQEPTMFEGTVRSNLDPLEEYSDEQIWEALDKCQLGDEVRKKEGKLDSKVIENGENWSVGQRQLVCLGRVLLKKSKILVLDEATASVDTATDNLIQLTLREHFTDCTVVTIAHRITSILDSDMVLLLDHGLVCEYDTPKRLLGDKASSFAQLVTEYTMRSSSSSSNS